MKNNWFTAGFKKKKKTFQSHFHFQFPPFFFSSLSIPPSFFFISQFSFIIKKKNTFHSLSIVSTFLVHPFPSPFTVIISLFSHTFSCPHSPFFFKFAGCLWQ